MRFIIVFLLGVSSLAFAHPLPGTPSIEDLELPEDLSKSRRAFIETSLESAATLKLNRYLFGSADPAKGGFDCSGSVYYLLRTHGIQPPRSSAAQFDWIKSKGKLIEVPEDLASLDDPVFSKLQPGDLLFWSGTYKPTDGRKNKITHVQIYLGRERKDGLHVMIGSSDGRSYRGSARTGFGTFNFRLPSAKSKSRFVGFGSPPGLDKEPG